MLRLAQDLRDVTRLDHRTVEHGHHPISYVGDDAHVVGDQQDAGVRLMLQPAQQVQDPGPHAMAVAMTMRLRCPPEHWCGCCLIRRRRVVDPALVDELDRTLQRIAHRRCRGPARPP
ncbi:hypothetical protein [Nesterenkonia halophila]|uniref:hypothetical protein n=1 Tax=Nesterenkonia halophila TaxID=302044 RepID=UPI001478773B|nr:hypothetical protein [Nesterenkonia halophila]